MPPHSQTRLRRHTSLPPPRPALTHSHAPYGVGAFPFAHGSRRSSPSELARLRSRFTPPHRSLPFCPLDRARGVPSAAPRHPHPAACAHPAPTAPRPLRVPRRSRSSSQHARAFSQWSLEHCSCRARAARTHPRPTPGDPRKPLRFSVRRSAPAGPLMPRPAPRQFGGNAPRSAWQLALLGSRSEPTETVPTDCPHISRVALNLALWGISCLTGGV